MNLCIPVSHSPNRLICLPGLVKRVLLDHGLENFDGALADENYRKDQGAVLSRQEY